MQFVREVLDVGRRAVVDALHGRDIEDSSPFSPDVPEDLRSWLPDLFDRFPIVLPWGRAKSIDPAHHNVWILDNTAFRTPAPGDRRPDLAELEDPNHTQPRKVGEPGQTSQALTGGSGWQVEYVACYFIKNSGRNVAHVAGEIIKHLHDVNQDDVATRKRISDRVQPFVDAILPYHTVRIKIDEMEEQTLGPSSYSGISSGLHELHLTPSSTQFQTTVCNVPPPFGLPSTTVLAEERGWGIISDIDDTIKITQTPDPIGILHNTFSVKTPEPVPGMPELYAHMQRTLTTTGEDGKDNSPPFFYLSASPYNLYPFLRRFRENHFPMGTLILREASWRNLGGLIASLQQNTMEYKSDRITKIHAQFPHRKYICIGDSTQSDPEAYGEAARKYPGWIKAVFIRKVTGIAAMDEKTKNSTERFEKAFRRLDRRLWHVFTEPSELAERVDELSRNVNAMVGGK